MRFQPCTVGSGRRLNLFIPNIERSRMYGGQKTAFRFFTALLDACGGDARILVDQPCDAHQLEVLREQYPDWQIIGAGEQSAAARQIVILDPDTRERAQLPVRPLDYFVYTYWTGAYALAQYEAFQREAFGRATPHIHLIQDFEPGFKAWSADYLLADSIYHQPNTIAVFNSVELKDWFDRLGYGFTSSYVFSPKLDPDIAKHLHDVTSPTPSPSSIRSSSRTGSTGLAMGSPRHMCSARNLTRTSPSICTMFRRTMRAKSCSYSTGVPPFRAIVSR